MGFVIAVSSTTIVLRGLSSRDELDTDHGRLSVGILIFQDLCAAPMILALPFLAGLVVARTEEGVASEGELSGLADLLSGVDCPKGMFI